LIAGLESFQVESGAQERLAKNESFFRQVNERIKDVGETFSGDEYDFLCECADPGCTDRILLTNEQYEEVRAKPTRFVLAPGHASPEIEHVVKREDEHVVVEKRGVAGRIAAKLDPRTA
jgi:hypothetical protein